jgi:hypothetical protein
LAEDPPASGPIYLPKYFQIFPNFIPQDIAKMQKYQLELSATLVQRIEIQCEEERLSKAQREV